MESLGEIARIVTRSRVASISRLSLLRFLGLLL